MNIQHSDISIRKFFKIVSAVIVYSNSTKIKEELLQNLILNQRKKACHKIILFLKNYISRVHLYKAFLISYILSQREKAANAIKSIMKGLLLRRYVSDIFEKTKRCFTVISAIKNVNRVELKVLLQDNSAKTYQFSYCRIRKKFVLYISRSKVRSEAYNVNFIADGKVVIDPTFRSEYEGGRFYNIIDFKEFADKEWEADYEKRLFVKYHTQLINRQLLAEKILTENYLSRNSNSTTEMQIQSTMSVCSLGMNNHQDNEGKLYQEDVQLKHSKSIQIKKSLEFSSYLSLGSLRLNSKRHKTQINLLSRPKSILKSPMSNKNTTKPPKKVSFGSITQF